MFNKDKQTQERVAANSATLISAGTTLHGDIKSENDLRIDGTVHGNIDCTAKIIIGPSGFIDGNIKGQQADVTGKVNGNIVVTELLQLKGQGNVQGNITATKLQIDPTATFNGQCNMGVAVANIVQMSENETGVKVKAK
jgi:cytoskeletal protein CcmA (bactofilin family)